MKRTMRILAMATLVLMGTVMTGCTSGELVDDQPESKSKTVTLTTTVSCGAAGTKAVTPSGVKTFDVGDRIAVIYKNQNGETKVAESRKLTSADISGEGELENKIATFTVSLDDPKASAPVRYIYPYYMCNRYAAATEAVTSDAFINYDALKTDQCGLIEVLGNNFDLAIFDGAMTSDLNLPASATLVNQLAICAFTLKDHTGNTIVTNGLTQLVVDDGNGNVYTVNPVSSSAPFDQSVVYVAIKPVTAALEVTATDGAVSYSKTLTSREYARNNGYNISLRMNASVEYLEGRWSSPQVNFTETSAENPTLITNDFSGSITSGYYAVTGDNVVITGVVELTGETHLILCDGAKLTVNGYINTGSVLYIYGQDAGTGKLNVSAESAYDAFACNNQLYIHGGDISITSTNSSALSLGMGFTMYGGNLTTSSTKADCIHCSQTIKLYGGTIVASNDSDNYNAIFIEDTRFPLTVYGGRLLASNPSGTAIYGYVKSGPGTNIKFYGADKEGEWNEGVKFVIALDAPVFPYVKAE